MERFAVSERRLTAEEFLRIPEDGKRHELVDGVHYVPPSPNLPHQVLVGRLHLRWDQRVKRRLFDERGVGEYWLVDPVERRVTVLRRAGDGSFPEVAALAADRGEYLATPLLPAWSLDVAGLFMA